MDSGEQDEICAIFYDRVDMAPAELEAWLGNDDPKADGVSDTDA